MSSWSKKASHFAEAFLIPRFLAEATPPFSFLISFRFFKTGLEAVALMRLTMFAELSVEPSSITISSASEKVCSLMASRVFSINF